MQSSQATKLITIWLSLITKTTYSYSNGHTAKHTQVSKANGNILQSIRCHNGSASFHKIVEFNIIYPNDWWVDDWYSMIGSGKKMN